MFRKDDGGGGVCTGPPLGARPRAWAEAGAAARLEKI